MRVWRIIAAVVGLAVIALMASIQYILAIQSVGPEPGRHLGLPDYVSALVYAVASLPTVIAMLAVAAVFLASGGRQVRRPSGATTTESKTKRLPEGQRHQGCPSEPLGSHTTTLLRHSKSPGLCIRGSLRLCPASP